MKSSAAEPGLNQFNLSTDITGRKTCHFAMVLMQNNIVNSGIHCRMTYGKILLYVKVTGKSKGTCK